MYSLKGGIKAWQGFKAKGPFEEGLVLITGKESPAEMVTVAYGMEEGLRRFYKEMSAKGNNPQLSKLLVQLSEVEERHKTKLFELYQGLVQVEGDIKAFERHVSSEVMEGGLSPEEFLLLNQPALETTEEILTMAMVLETQALDLYLRYSFRSKDQKTKEALYRIGDEEKTHLEALGRLMEKH